ncbi:LuxR family transcriptional regulator [Paenibacillus kobensis]|uniref:LuxR family transcriptional regulator n=1 Tax=Paenibacillus kobensis TaxID=59841 RepID=UPI000FD87BFD|nr:LuxR family transcriptional regulator [Paenibacillus kobensis]
MSSFGDEIRQLEESYFVGRSMELEAFRNIVVNSDSTSTILNISGTGGIGKSSLLDQFQRICAREGVPFIQLDCVDFTKTTTGFTSRLLAILKVEAVNEGREDELLQQAEQQLNHLADKGRLVLAIDTYEEMDELDDWLRNTFLVRLSSRIIILLAGRFPLKGGWVSSPAWRRLVKFMPLSPFDLETCKAYSSIHGECDESFVRQSYLITKGHPLALSLYIGVHNREQEPETLQWQETFKEIAGRWLRELPDPALCELLEAVTMMRVFNHEIVETMLEREISNEEFDKLIHLSFVRKTERGWYLHQVLRKALYQDFRLRKPQIYHRLWQRSVKYHYGLLTSGHVATEERNLLLLDYIYVVGDPGFRAMFYDDAIDQSYYFESIHEDNLHEAEQYVQDVLVNLKDFVQEMFDPVTNEKYTYKIPKSVNEKWFTSIQLSEVISLGKDAVRLLKNEKNEAVGMFIYIPVHRQSLPLLEQNPITQSYFRALSRQERDKLNVSPESPAGWFQYKIDFSKDGSAAARFMFFQSYLSYYLKGGVMIYTTPMKYLQEAVKGIGYLEIPRATHKAFGPDFPAPVMALDFREDKDMKKFVDNLYRSTKIDSKDEALDAVLSGLTPREREIALLAITCSSNEEIAQKLYLSEITVKKNLSRIYEKLEVKGKTELVKKLMS